jgi:hypothetical protein
LLETISIISLGATIMLVIINGAYIYLTKKTLDTAVRQSNLVYNPVIGIQIKDVSITETFGPNRRQMSVGVGLTNVGNAPAIDVLIDAEVILQYSSVEGEKTIPARFEPASLPFISIGGKTTKEWIHPNFGNVCVTHILDDFREYHRLNILRIESDATRMPYPPTKLKIYVYYRNSIGQYFESTYEAHFDLESDEIPKENESAKLSQIGIPRPQFHTGPISKDEMDKEISKRNGKRGLCGW